MVQLLGGLELGLRLLDVDVVLGLLLADDLQSVTLASSGLVADQKDLASRARAEFVDHAVLHSGKPGRARDLGHSEPLRSDSGLAFTRMNTSSGCACVFAWRGPASRGPVGTGSRNSNNGDQLRTCNSSTSKIRLELEGIFGFSISP